MIDYSAAKFWLDVAHWFVVILLAIWVYLRTKDTDNEKKVGAVSEQLASFIKASNEANEQQNNRLTVLEEAVKHLPTGEEVAQIASDVASMKERLEGQSQLLGRVERQTNLIHDYLLNKPR